MKVEEKTYTQNQTDTKHILKTQVGPLRMCFCSFDRRYPAEEEEIDLMSDDLCRTCAKSYCKANDIDYDELVENAESDASEVVA